MRALYTGLAALVAASIAAGCATMRYDAQYNSNGLILTTEKDGTQVTEMEAAYGRDALFWQRHITSCNSYGDGKSFDGWPLVDPVNNDDLFRDAPKVEYDVTSTTDTDRACGSAFREYNAALFDEIRSYIANETTRFIDDLADFAPASIAITGDKSVKFSGVPTKTIRWYAPWIEDTFTYDITINNGRLMYFEAESNDGTPETTDDIKLEYIAGKRLKYYKPSEFSTYAVTFTELPAEEDKRIQGYFGDFAKNVLKLVRDNTRRNAVTP